MDLHVGGSVLPTPAVMVSIYGPICSYRVLQSFGTAYTAVCGYVVECYAAVCDNQVLCNAAVCEDKEPGSAAANIGTMERNTAFSSDDKHLCIEAKGRQMEICSMAASSYRTPRNVRNSLVVCELDL